MKSGMHGKSAFSAAVLGAMLLLPGCERKGEGPKPCCDQPDIPAGVANFKVVADDVSGPGDGLKVMLRAGLTQPAKRDQIYGPLKVLYAYAMKRSPLEPIHVEAWLYANESAAQEGGEANVIAKVIRDAERPGAARCENRVKYDFPEQAERAYIWSTRGEQELQEDRNDTCHIAVKKKVARYDEKFTHKTSYTLDQARAAIELTYPFLGDGQGRIRG